MNIKKTYAILFMAIIGLGIGVLFPWTKANAQETTTITGTFNSCTYSYAPGTKELIIGAADSDSYDSGTVENMNLIYSELEKKGVAYADITKISYDTSVQILGDRALCITPYIEEVIIPNTVNSLANNFLSNQSLGYGSWDTNNGEIGNVTIEVPSSVANIGEWAVSADTYGKKT